MPLESSVTADGQEKKSLLVGVETMPLGLICRIAPPPAIKTFPLWSTNNPIGSVKVAERLWPSVLPITPLPAKSLMLTLGCIIESTSVTVNVVVNEDLGATRCGVGIKVNF